MLDCQYVFSCQIWRNRIARGTMKVACRAHRVKRHQISVSLPGHLYLSSTNALLRSFVFKLSERSSEAFPFTLLNIGIAICAQQGMCSHRVWNDSASTQQQFQVNGRLSHDDGIIAVRNRSSCVFKQSHGHVRDEVHALTLHR